MSAQKRIRELEAENARLRRRIPRCSGKTSFGYQCAASQGHSGPHSHPNDAFADPLSIEAFGLTDDGDDA